jgi:hypothetical protein
MWYTGPRPVEAEISGFRPANRDFGSPWPLLGNVSTGDLTLLPKFRNVRRGRYDVFQVDMNNWREQVRAAYRGYHKAIMDYIIAAHRR